MTTERHITRSVEETHAVARAVLTRLPARAVLAMHGDLGSGKTCFVQGLALALGIDRPVTSPTFILVNEYRGPRPLVHIDLYRLHDPDDALALGFEEYVQADAITAVEWAERAGDVIPPDAVHLHFTALDDPDSREIRIEWPA